MAFCYKNREETLNFLEKYLLVFFFFFWLMQSTSKLSLKKKTIVDERGYLRKSLKKYILSHCTSFQIDVTPGGCESSFKASCPTGEQNWHLIAWSPVVSAVFSASGDYSVMMWKIKIQFLKYIFHNQSIYKHIWNLYNLCWNGMVMFIPQ